MADPLVIDGYVFNLQDDLRPVYRLNPFSTESRESYEPIEKEELRHLLSERFGGHPFVYTANGRQAIREALKLLSLTKHDCVTILTSTGNYYISGCVTSEIEQFCQWSRKVEANTKALFVNHEFGVPYPNLSGLKTLGLPIIEDCCYSFNSGTIGNMMGKVGDFVVFSFAKYFSVQFGGVLVSRGQQKLPDQLLDSQTEEYLKRTIASQYKGIGTIAVRRQSNHAALVVKLAPIGLRPRFDFDKEGIPGVFMFVAPDDWNLSALKDFMWSCGIHCSVFYGEQVFFIPVHQALTTEALEYFAVCLQQFAAQQKRVV